MAALAALPALSLVGHDAAYLAGPHSELPVKIWAFETFRGTSLLGGEIDTVAFPNTGTLNNADPLGSLVYGVLRPLLGSSAAYNTLVLAQLFAAMVAVWLLARDLLGDALSAVTAAVGFALTPLMLVYPVVCGITDILNLWPYPLALLFGLRALRRTGWRDGLLAGLFAGLGFVTCPYNFVVFTAMALPIVLWLPVVWRRGLSLEPGDGQPLRVRQLGLAAATMLVGVLLAAGWYVLWMKVLMADPGAQVSDEVVAGTRHRPPFQLLHPAELKRYTAFLGEYFAIGKGEIVARDMISRFYRAFSPGLLLMALGLLGVAAVPSRRRASGIWLVIAVFFALASTGPFLPWSSSRCFDSAMNLSWLVLHWAWPGGRLILEPFRYALVAAFALSVAASLGVSVLRRRLGSWVAVVVPLLVVAEVVLLSPVPIPLPVTELRVSPAYERLDEVLPPGPIIELPWFDRGSQRFQRQHFLNQLVHGRPIADEVIGFPPRYLVENQFMAQVIATEKPYGEIALRVVDPRLIPVHRDHLAADGFVGIVLDPEGFDSPSRAARVMVLLNLLDEPAHLEDRLVYRLEEPPDPDVVPRPERE